MNGKSKIIYLFGNKTILEFSLAGDGMSSFSIFAMNKFKFSCEGIAGDKAFKHKKLNIPIVLVHIK